MPLFADAADDLDTAGNFLTEALPLAVRPVSLSFRIDDHVTGDADAGIAGEGKSCRLYAERSSTKIDVMTISVTDARLGA